MILKRTGIIIILFLFANCSRHFVKEKMDFAHFSLKESAPQAAMNDSVARFRKIVDAETARIIGEARDNLTKDGNQSSLGNFVCDALRFVSDEKLGKPVDIVLINRGGLRANIAKGNISVGNIFEVMPFENEMVVVKIKGASLVKFLPMLVEKMHPFYGLKIKIVNHKVISATIEGKEIEAEKEYLVVSSDYLYNGGDNFNFLREGGEPQYLDIKIRDAIIRYCENQASHEKKIIAYTDDRLEVSK